MSEYVLVTPSVVADAFIPNQGFTLGFRQEVLMASFYMDRAKAEEDETHRQIIPYAYVIDEEGDLLEYQRVGGEERLLGNKSLGFGGHINPEDLKSPAACVIRELREELGIFVPPEYQVWCGFIRDDSNQVGKVHLGLVIEVTIDREVTATCPNITNVQKFQGMTDEFETWSQILYKDFLRAKNY